MDCLGNVLESLVYRRILELPDLAEQTDLQGPDCLVIFSTAFCNDEPRRTRLPPHTPVRSCSYERCGPPPMNCPTRSCGRALVVFGKVTLSRSMLDA
jgi:hypothetical protein